jgi:hypothetical protein
MPMLFQKNPSKLLDAARSNCNKLTARLAEAEATVNACRSAAKGLARSGASDDQLDKAEAQLRAAQDRVGTLQAALTETNAEVVQIETELAAQLDRQLRTDTAQTVEADAKELVEAAASVNDSVVRLAEVAARISRYVIDASGLVGFAQKVKTEIPPNVALLDSVMRSFAQATMAGHGKATLPPLVEVVAPEARPQPAPTTRVDPVKSDPRVTPPIMYEPLPRGNPRVVAIPAAASRNQDKSK